MTIPFATKKEMDNSFEFPKLHIAYITVEIADSEILCGIKPICFELSRILHEYANMFKDGRGGQQAVEVYTDQNGNKLTSSTATWLGHEIPHEIQSHSQAEICQQSK